MEQEIRVGERSPTRCPYCKDDLGEALTKLVSCAACGVRHHASCHEEHGACSSCGSSEALYPRRRGRVAPSGLLAGSKVEVTTEGETTRFSWPARTPHDWLLIFFAGIFPPLAVLLLLAWRRTRTCSLELGPESISFDTLAPWFRDRRVEVSRQELGAVRVGLGGLTVDQGITRHVVRTGLVNPVLTPPELEWLAERIEAWKAEG